MRWVMLGNLCGVDGGQSVYLRCWPLSHLDYISRCFQDAGRGPGPALHPMGNGQNNEQEMSGYRDDERQHM